VKSPTSILSSIRDNADRLPGTDAFTFLSEGDLDGPRESVTFAALDERARAVAAALTDEGLMGERAVLLYAPGLDFIAAFLACLHAGVIAVPAYPPDLSRLDRTLPRLRAIVRDCSARAVLTSSFIAGVAEALVPHAPELATARWIATDTVGARAFEARDIAASDVAFLQYTSGSTGAPKGVKVTHGNLLDNSEAIRRVGKAGPHTVAVNWLPCYHDMGLIGAILQPLFTGFPSVLMPPMAFLRRPARWLQAITHFRGTDSAFPNFALDLCVRKVSDAELSGLDLASWNTAWNGAEPVRNASLERFARRFGPRGFRRGALLPVYGLAESTLIVAGERSDDTISVLAIQREALGRHETRAALVGDHDAVSVVGCGRPIAGAEIAIVEPERRVRVGPGEVGEIWVRGPSIAAGYWGREEESAAAFDACLADGGEGPFLRTGDLGFIDDGQLFITGRSKDLIVVRGANYYPQDIELAVEGSHPGVRAGSVAAVTLDSDEGEQLGLIVEVRDGMTGIEREEVVDHVREAVARAVSLSPRTVALVRTGVIPKTSSGKIQRYACRDGLARGTLSTLWVDTLGAGAASQATACP
jgi:acyl-CoA synthetase (AMP-forming)/AMP-acid ligase II